MPDVTVQIGGREFSVACQSGEEPFLHSAARMLDTEAQTLLAQIGRVPEARSFERRPELRIEPVAQPVADQIDRIDPAGASGLVLP